MGSWLPYQVEVDFGSGLALNCGRVQITAPTNNPESRATADRSHRCVNEGMALPKHCRRCAFSLQFKNHRRYRAGFPTAADFGSSQIP